MLYLNFKGFIMIFYIFQNCKFRDGGLYELQYILYIDLKVLKKY